MDEQRLEALVLLQVHRNDTPTTDAVIDRFAATAARRLDLILQNLSALGRLRLSTASLFMHVDLNSYRPTALNCLSF